MAMTGRLAGLRLRGKNVEKKCRFVGKAAFLKAVVDCGCQCERSAAL